jgi:hypothetical protein
LCGDLTLFSRTDCASIFDAIGHRLHSFCVAIARRVRIDFKVAAQRFEYDFYAMLHRIRGDFTAIAQ